jgi:hypothetical protein
MSSVNYIKNNNGIGIRGRQKHNQLGYIQENISSHITWLWRRDMDSGHITLTTYLKTRAYIVTAVTEQLIMYWISSPLHVWNHWFLASLTQSEMRNGRVFISWGQVEQIENKAEENPRLCLVIPKPEWKDPFPLIIGSWKNWDPLNGLYNPNFLLVSQSLLLQIT